MAVSFVQDNSAPMCLAFDKRLVACATEHGFVYLLDKDTLAVHKLFQGHSNAIFDLKWRPYDSGQFLTAGGDRSMCLFDVHDLTSNRVECQSRPIFVVDKAHTSSIKSVSWRTPFVCASGSRDGCIRVWDFRLNPLRCCTMVMEDAHKSTAMMPVRRRPPNYSDHLPKRSSPLSCVTCVVFKPTDRT